MNAILTVAVIAIVTVAACVGLTTLIKRSTVREMEDPNGFFQLMTRIHNKKGNKMTGFDKVQEQLAKDIREAAEKKKAIAAQRTARREQEAREQLDIHISLALSAYYNRKK